MKGVELLTLKKIQNSILMCECTERCMKCQHIVLLIHCCNLIMTSFLFLMKNIYEYIHYIQSLKSIWTKMSTWGCYFFVVLIFFSFLFHYRHVKCVYYFLRKYWMYSKKNDKKPVLIPEFYFIFFPQKISKMETKYKKTSKNFARTFLKTFTVHSEEKKSSGWIQLNTLPLQSWSYK